MTTRSHRIAAFSAAFPLPWTAPAVQAPRTDDEHRHEDAVDRPPRTEARAAAAASGRAGLTGRPAALASAAEQAFIETITGTASRWRPGGADAAGKGVRRRVAGPEAGSIVHAGGACAA